MPTPSRIAAVTGANKGIGLAIVRNLALQYPTSPLNNPSQPLLIFLTARDAERGAQAVQRIHEDAEIKKAGVLERDGGLVGVEFLQLDVGDEGSVRSFAEHLRNKGGEGEGGVLDVLVNNAGIALDGFDSNIAHTTLKVNYHGTLNMTSQLLPLLKPTGRLVNVASMAGHLSKYPPALRTQFLATTTVPAVTTLMDAFEAAVKAGTHTQDGWPSGAYAVSKTGVIGMTRTVAREEKERGGKRSINSCCPGYVNTDMTKGNGVKTVDEGARTPVLLACGDVGAATGEFWQGERVVEW